MITHSTAGCCVLRLPQRLTSSFRWRHILWLRRLENLRLAPTALQSGSTGGQLSRLGSAFHRSARPVANLRFASAVARFRSTGGDPSDLRRTILPPARPATNFRLAPGVDPSARLVSSLRLSPAAVATCQLALTAAATSSLRLLSPVCHTGGEPPTRIGCSSSSFTGFDSPDLRRMFLPPAGPLMHPLLQPNLASAAEPPMSIPYPPVRAPSGSASLTTSDLRRLLQCLARPAIPLRLSPQVSPSGRAGVHFPILIGFSFRQPFRQPTPNALQGHQLNETVRPFNLWKQVQKTSKFVDFTKVGA